ncbi:7TM diverse intracellular signaling domain-containing protein [Inhella proteolytica]|uniref:histidine kinase n=1 Tax=Inhella proteolytica TaxID=2795029 RepID=A0A931NCT3_9BURK|nr:7TM diverse intracellular signaling domain-containing protein [Inhella proteolytica]MBH9575912.1 sensor histidine kinase [Inhella proteolytica]
MAELLMRGLLILMLWGLAVYEARAQSCSTAPEAQNLQACSQLAAAPSGADASLRWQRIELQGAGPQTRVLALGVPDVQALELWQAQGGEPQRRWRLQALDAQTARPLPGPRLALPLSLAPGRNTLWLGYRVHGDGRLDPQLLSPGAERQAQQRRDVLNGLIFGVMVTLAAVVATARWVGGPSAYLAYVALVLAQLLMLLHTEGYAFAWLWPELAGWNQRAPLVLGLLSLAAHAAFAMQFLQMRQHMPRLWRAHALLLALLLPALGAVLLPDAVRLGVLMGLLYAPLALGAAVQAWRLGLPGAPLYTLGAGALLLVSVLFFSLGVLGLNPLPSVHFLDYPKIGALLEAAFFSAAFINRVRAEQRRQAEQRLRRLAEAEELLALEQQRQAALALAQRQGLRLAGASHDISQPLASLRFAIEALKRSAAPGAITQHLDHTLAYAQTLLSDLIQQTRAELPSGPDRIALGPWLREQLAQHEAAAAARGLRLRLAPCRAELQASQLMLARVLHNLLGNALRYTARGRVLVGVRRRPGALELQVWDSGPGLAPAQLERLQQPFERGSSAADGGHGLGLFIVKSLCEQCGWTLRIHSRLGRGSGFCVRIPQAPITVDTVSA